MWWLVFAAHATLMAIDEGIFHRKRFLPRWERIGHPLDTLSVIIPVSVLYFLPAQEPLFMVLAIFSCLFVTKDEWVHSEHCEATENWLHALLFILHPIIFYASWKLIRDPFFPAVLVAMGLWGLYQAVYWNGKYGNR